jgi:hypothetical protein
MMLDNGYYCVFNLSKSKGRFTKSSIICNYVHNQDNSKILCYKINFKVHIH